MAKLHTAPDDPQVTRKRPKFENYKDYLNWRLDRRVETIAARVQKVKRYVNGLPDGEFSGDEKDRIWLDQFVKGSGLDICCGDFLAGEDFQASGVDGAEKMVGTDYFSEGDELAFSTPEMMDYVVSNYLDCFPNPLKALNEWWRCLKVGGTLAIVCRNAEAYYPKYAAGPMDNHRRNSVYTYITLNQYLRRAGFKTVTVEKTEHSTLRAIAIK